MRTLLIIACLGIIVSLPAQKKPTSAEKAIAAFDAYVTQGKSDFGIPGMAVAVIRDNKVIFLKAYGQRRMDKPDPIDLHTQFSIGSTTKAMTAVCMGMLVDEGKVKWDDRVIQHLPDLQLFDSYATRTLRIRDLFTHNSGVGNADFLWSNMTIAPDEIVRKMAQVEPSYPLRGGFIYQNIFYLIAGQLIGRVTGSPWQDFIRTRIFKPLQMEHTVPFLRDGDRGNEAHPHHPVNGKIEVIPHSSADNVGPAGSVRSCITDMAEWTRCMLDSSKYLGGRLLKPGTWAEMFKPQVIVPSVQFYPTQQLTQPSWMTYGLGWFQQDYKGRKLNYHTGSLPGEIALHAQLPSEKLGYYFLGNLDHAELRHALMYKAFDHFALGGTRDWNFEVRLLYSDLNQRQQKAEDMMLAAKINGTSTSHKLEEFIGTYSHPLHGKLTITMENGSLKADLNNTINARLEHFHYDTFLAYYSEAWMGKGIITFSANEVGRITKVGWGGIQFER